MIERLKQEIEKVNLSYERRAKEAAKIYAGFDEEVEELTNIVSQEFKKVLSGIDMSFEIYDTKSKAVINDFKVRYSRSRADFEITIDEWGIDIYGKSYSDKSNGSAFGYCAYHYLEKVIRFSKEDPKIAEFKKDFNVNSISYNCRCGSDHK
jgi:hypothetical protein